MFDTSLEHDKEELLPLIWAAQYMIRTLGCLAAESSGELQELS